MNNLPFDKPGRFYRGNLHAHSDSSDGTLPPEELADLYREAGYDFLVVTDHFLREYGFPVTDTRPCRREGFETLLGAELHAPETGLGEDWHILAVGLPPGFPARGASEGGPELARRAREAGAFVGIAHPAWYGLTPADAESLDGAAHAVEVTRDPDGRGRRGERGREVLAGAGRLAGRPRHGQGAGAWRGRAGVRAVAGGLCGVLLQGDGHGRGGPAGVDQPHLARLIEEKLSPPPATLRRDERPKSRANRRTVPVMACARPAGRVGNRAWKDYVSGPGLLVIA